MLIKKLTVALILTGFAVLPVQAGERVNGTILQGMSTTTAACSYGYARSKKTGKCFKLKCASNKMLDTNGHKCVAKPKKKTYRGSY